MEFPSLISEVKEGLTVTTLCRIELHCPICDNSFQSEAVVSTNAFGGKRTDFHERAAGKQPLAYLVHMCGRCGYSGAERDFTDGIEVTAGLKQQVWKELAPLASSATMTGSEKYEAAAKVAEWQGTDARYVADLLLRAAWCCVDDFDVEAERYYRRLAARNFEIALAAYDAVPRAERAVLTYLVGELWRRVGDSKLADAWFDKVAKEVIDASVQQWIVEVANQQKREPSEWFG